MADGVTLADLNEKHPSWRRGRLNPGKGDEWASHQSSATLFFLN